MTVVTGGPFPLSPRLKWSGLRVHPWEMSGLKWAVFYNVPCLHLVFSAIALSLLSERGFLCSWYCLSCFWFCQSFFLCIWVDVLPTCCPLSYQWASNRHLLELGVITVLIKKHKDEKSLSSSIDMPVLLPKTIVWVSGFKIKSRKLEDGVLRPCRSKEVSDVH